MAVVALALACSLMAKPMLVTLPFLLLLLDFWPLRRLAGGAIADKAPAANQFSPSALLLEKIPLFLVSVGSCVMTVYAQTAGGAVRSLDAMPLDRRLANALDATCRYMEQMVCPTNLAVFYPLPRGGLPWSVVLAESLLLLGVTVAVCWLARSRPYLLVGWFWYLGTLVPVIGIVQVGEQARADRYTYIPLIGLFLLLVWGAHDLVAKRGGVLVHVAGGIVSAGILLVCVVLTRAQVTHWADASHLWSHALAVTNDNWLAHANYSHILLRQGNAYAALDQIEQAVRSDPDRAYTYHEMGQVYEALERRDEAEACYRKGMALRPNATGYRNDLAVLEERRKSKSAPKEGPKACP